jgi:hypothetical protein
MAEEDQKPPETTTDTTRQWRVESIRRWLIDSRNPFTSTTWWGGKTPYPFERTPFSRGYRGREAFVVEPYVRLANEAADVFTPSYRNEIDEFGEEVVKGWMVHRLRMYLWPRVKQALFDAALQDARQGRPLMYLEMLRGGEYESEKIDDPFCRLLNPMNLSEGTPNEELYRPAERDVIDKYHLATREAFSDMLGRPEQQDLVAEFGVKALWRALAPAIVESTVRWVQVRVVEQSFLNNDEPWRVQGFIENVFGLALRGWRGRKVGRAAFISELWPVLRSFHGKRVKENPGNPLVYVGGATLRMAMCQVNITGNESELGTRDLEHTAAQRRQAERLEEWLPHVETEEFSDSDHALRHLWEDAPLMPEQEGSAAMVLPYCFALTKNEAERVYLQFFTAGLSRTEAGRKAGLNQGQIQALEDRLERNVPI